MEIQYTKRLEKIEAQIRSWLPENPDSEWVKKVFGISDEIKAALVKNLTLPGWDLVNRGGKRWRPLLMLLSAEAVGGERGAEAALPLTPLVEFPHNASLIHDDIEDNSDERRGKPAVHLIYGTDTAINGGAFMYFLPLACLSGCGNAALKERVFTAWAGHMRALHLGQAMDIAWHRDFHSLPGLDEYDRMCRLKTGCLARLAAILGVYAGSSSGGAGFSGEADFSSGADLLNGASVNALAGIFAGAAEELGVGFQILDDVKNLDSGVPGKKRGDDIVEGKKSLPVLLFLHRYPEKTDFAARCFTAARSGGAQAPEVEEFILCLKNTGVLEEARAKGQEYIQNSVRAFSAPAGILLHEEGRKLLAGFINLLV